MVVTKTKTLQGGELADGVGQASQLVVVERKRLQGGELADGVGQASRAGSYRAESVCKAVSWPMA